MNSSYCFTCFFKWITDQITKEIIYYFDFHNKLITDMFGTSNRVDYNKIQHYETNEKVVNCNTL